MKYTDEHLSAFLDGQLPAQESRTLEAELETNLEIAERLASLAEANEAVKEAYKAEIERPIAPHISALLQSETAQTASTVMANDNASDNVVALPARRKISVTKWVAPLAATLALMIGLTVGRGMSVTPTNQGAIYAQITGTIDADNPLFNVLEHTPSATHVKLDTQVSVKPVLTFQTAEGLYCREFTAQSTASASRGIACREDGNWNILMLNRTELSDETGFRTASATSSEALDQLIDGLIDGAPFDLDTEKAAMTKNWAK
jgi:negative regulator of sigma E activity